MRQEERAQLVRSTAAMLKGVEYRGSPRDARVYGPLHRSAAVLVDFDLEALQAAHPEAAKSERYALLGDCQPLAPAGAENRWTLDPEVRRKVLRQIGSKEGLRACLEAARGGRRGLLQRTFEGYVDGWRPPPIAGQELTQLTAALKALSWLGELVDASPAAAEIRERIELLVFLKPFRDLVGDNFRGRGPELATLSDYVGVLEASSSFEALKRGLRQVFNFDEKPPLMVHGLGGMGKSTLLAKFLLDHAAVEGERQLPFVYVDFDRPALSAREPVSLLFEALGQLATQFPRAKKSLLGLRDAWEKQLQDEVRRRRGTGSNEPASGSVPRVSAKTRVKMLEEFGSILGVLERDDQPLLCILDTLEEVQYQGFAVVKELWSFLESLQERHPRLRVVLSGRVPIAGGLGATPEEQQEADRLLRTKSLPLSGLDRKAAESYLRGAGVGDEKAKTIARYITRAEDGVSPLILRVAVGVWEKRREAGEDADAALDDRYWAELEAGRIQAQLIRRYLSHVHDKRLEKLAYPGFVLRRLSPEVILRVLAEPCGVDVPDLDAARDLFQQLAEEVALVTTIYGGEAELRPRPEVRQLVTELMDELEGEKIERIHLSAVAYYAELSDAEGAGSDAWLEARAEEIYHRLALKQDEAVIRDRWSPSVASAVAGAADELGAVERGLLNVLAGRRVSEQVRRQISQASWEKDAARRVREHVDLGQLEDALKVLDERDERAPGSVLHVLRGRVLAGLERWDELAEAMASALDSFDRGVGAAIRIDVLCLAAEAEARLERPEAALARLEEARSLADAREEALRLLQIELSTLRALAGENRPEEEEAARARLEEALLRAPAAELKERMDLAVQAAGRLGAAYPAVLARALALGALEGVTDRQARALGRALGRFDRERSEREGQEPGWVATKAGLDVSGSATRAWQRFLTETPTLAGGVLSPLIEEHRVPAGHQLLEAIVRVLPAEASLDEAASLEPASLGAAPTTRAARRKRRSRGKAAGGEALKALHGALLEAFTLDELKQLVRFRLDRSLESMVLLDQPLGGVVLGLLEVAEKEGWLDSLVVAAREARPDDPELFRVASELGLTAARVSGEGLERLVKSSSSFFDPGRWRRWLGAVEGQVCRVEIAGPEGGGYGTGFLVSPELLLTAYHVLEPVLAGSIPPDAVTFRFDFKQSAGGDAIHAGTEFRLAEDDWRVESSPYAAGDTDVAGEAPTEDQLDFALVRLDGYPGDEPLGGGESHSIAARRGWIEVPAQPPNLTAEGPVVLVQHPRAGPLQVAFGGDGIVSVNDNGTRISYRASTERGSGGAPIFDLEGILLGLHSGRSAKAGTNFGVPIAAIVKYLESRGTGLAGMGQALA